MRVDLFFNDGQAHTIDMAISPHLGETIFLGGRLYKIEDVIYDLDSKGLAAINVRLGKPVDASGT
ncbi:MAG TPA: hypothetical protein VK993_05485 [Chthoniobacterales bacterium]|nr:hypothetical protein [Chthoniobacterales bacterium]